MGDNAGIGRSMTTHLNRIDALEDKFLAGDHSDDDWFLEQLRLETKALGIPLLFRTAPRIESFASLEANGIDLIQRNDDGSTLLTNIQVPFDLPTYRWLAEKSHQVDTIDLANNKGFTALSAKIKHGEIDNGRILLERGASIHSFATVAGYSNSKLDTPTRAVHCHLYGHSDLQEASIRPLSLMQEFGFSLDEGQVARMLQKIGDRKPKLKQWILARWPTKDQRLRQDQAPLDERPHD